MKIIGLISQILLRLVFIIVITFWFSAYNSAFEADRACHSLLSSYSNSTKLGVTMIQKLISGYCMKIRKTESVQK